MHPTFLYVYSSVSKLKDTNKEIPQKQSHRGTMEPNVSRREAASRGRSRSPRQRPSREAAGTIPPYLLLTLSPPIGADTSTFSRVQILPSTILKCQKMACIREKVLGRGRVSAHPFLHTHGGTFEPPRHAYHRVSSCLIMQRPAPLLSHLVCQHVACFVEKVLGWGRVCAYPFIQTHGGISREGAPSLDPSPRRGLAYARQ